MKKLDRSVVKSKVSLKPAACLAQPKRSLFNLLLQEIKMAAVSNQLLLALFL